MSKALREKAQKKLSAGIKNVYSKMTRRRGAANPTGLKRVGGIMRNPSINKKYQLDGFGNVPLGKMAKEGIEGTASNKKLSTTQAEARKGSIAKKPPPMPFPFMGRAGQYLNAIMDDSIEFGKK